MTEAVHTADPVDTSSPVAICERLGDIEDRLAFVTNELSRAAYWRRKYKALIEIESKVLYAQTEGTIPEREAAVMRILAGDNSELPQKLGEADATYDRYAKEFEGLDTRRSILQSTLKMHLREQEPRFGEGSHHR
jgi:hypothetical protein